MTSNGDSPQRRETACGLSPAQSDLLHRSVDFLDDVESDFAPCDASKTSRQRCIVDVKARFFGSKAA